jgi:hypothetical protein
MELLAQFLLRLAFGLAVGMGITSSRKVSSGYFRNHLYVTLGLATLAVLATASVDSFAPWLAGLAAAFSFIGAACWLYEVQAAGKVLLWLVAICALAAALALQGASGTSDGLIAWRSLSVITSGLVLGLVFAAMLLGHWYLNAPGMELAPLRRLILAAAIAVTAQAIASTIGLTAEFATSSQLSTNWILFVLLRWSFGICGVLAMLWMAWRTLEVPNTQSATGILYVAVIGVFVGELAALLLSAESAFPV